MSAILILFGMAAVVLPGLPRSPACALSRNAGLSYSLLVKTPESSPGTLRGLRLTNPIRSVVERLDGFRRNADSLNAAEAEETLLPILRDLLAGDGFAVIQRLRPEMGVDYVAEGHSAGRKLGVEYKHYEPGRPVEVSAIRRVLEMAERSGIDRLIVVARSGFSQSALEFAQHEHPLAIELTDLAGLHGWALRMERASGGQHSRIVQAIAKLSRAAARAVAENPHELAELEWRDLERMIAEVFQALGFDTELTPGSKDGGKDIIVSTTEEGRTLSYVVEVKHWRSGKSVGSRKVADFVEVVARERREGGLYLATYGYTHDAFGALTEAQRQRVKFGSREKIVALCETYVKAERGLWSPAATSLPGILFEGTH